MKQKTIGFVTYKKSPKITPSDLILAKSLELSGYLVQNVPWDDARIEWKHYNILVLRSAWNYHIYIDNFLKWLDKIKKLEIHLWNPYPLVKWNINKTYLFGLQKKGIEIIPTTYIKKEANIHLKNIFKEKKLTDIVIKPIFGADAYGIFSVNIKDAESKQIYLDKLLQYSDCVVQPIIKEIQNGELSIVFFGRNYSHTVLKKPAKNDFRTNYGFGGSFKLTEIKPNILAQAEKIIGVVNDDLLYARVDGVEVNGKFVLMELELAEPHLYCDLNPGSGEIFAERFKELDLY